MRCGSAGSWLLKMAIFFDQTKWIFCLKAARKNNHKYTRLICSWILGLSLFIGVRLITYVVKWPVVFFLFFFYWIVLWRFSVGYRFGAVGGVHNRRRQKYCNFGTGIMTNFIANWTKSISAWRHALCRKTWTRPDVPKKIYFAFRSHFGCIKTNTNESRKTQQKKIILYPTMGFTSDALASHVEILS